MGKSTRYSIEYESAGENKTLVHPTDQSKRFIETARELGCDEDEAEFLRKLGKIVRVKPADTEPPKDGS